MNDELNIIENFRREIERDANYEAKKILEESEKVEAEALEKIKEEASYDAKRKLQRTIEEITLENQKQISLTQQRTKLALIEKRNAIQEEIFTICKERLLAYTKQEDYQHFLQDLLKTVPEEDYVIQVREEDVKNMTKLSTLPVEATKEIKIGGFIAVNAKSGMVINHTLDLRLEDQKQWFYHHSGLTLND